MKTILVTGGSGLLGRHLVPVLEAQGAEVAAPDRSMLNLSRPLLASTLPARIDAVVHLAQSRRFREFPDGADDMFQVNTAAALALADYARRAGAVNFVYASSGGVYAPSGMPIGEGAPLAEPMGFYPASKRAAELLLAPFEAHFNLAILRYFFIYGLGQSRDMLVPRLIESVREGREVQLHGGDGLRLNPVHVGDAARATAAATRLAHSATINVAGPQVVSMRAMGEAIGEMVGRKPLFARNDAATPADLVADIAGMERLLGAATTSFDLGIAEWTA